MDMCILVKYPVLNRVYGTIPPMRSCIARITELRLDAGGRVQARITCPMGAIPRAGQYALASDPLDSDTALAEVFFPAEIDPLGFLAAAPVPHDWSPGKELVLRGPLGQGFDLPPDAHHIALAALGESAARLLPLAASALAGNASIAIFADVALPALPASLEIFPLAALPENLAWADFLALDLPLEKLPELRHCLGLQRGENLPCQVQALITTPMPCAAAAECGACTVPAKGGYKLACQDGPVFDLREIEW